MRWRWGRVRIEGEIWKNGSGKLLEMEGTMNENGGEYGRTGSENRRGKIRGWKGKWVRMEGGMDGNKREEEKGG